MFLKFTFGMIGTLFSILVRRTFPSSKTFYFVDYISKCSYSWSTQLRPITDLEKYLSVHQGRNFVKSHGKNTFDFVQMQAANRIFIECENFMWRIGNRELIKGKVNLLCPVFKS